MFLSGIGTVVVTSSSPSEQSWESDSIHNSYFTHFLIQALKQPGPEPPNVKTIFDYVQTKVSETVKREKGKPQHPTMKAASDETDVRIGVIPRGN